MKKEVVAHLDPKSPISEIFRTLRTNIQFVNSDQKTKTLLITSTIPGEGKSLVTANLAVAFAQAGKKVVLIDADMRKGRQYTIFGTKPKPGLSNFLSQIDIKEEGNMTKEIIACMQKTEVKDLYLIPAGTIPPNPSELLMTPKMTKLLEKLKKVCDIVIIDGTPCELVADAVILSRIVDSTIVVAAHKVTKKDALKRVIKSIQNVGGEIAGIVINKMPISGKKYEERYYYYSKNPQMSNVNYENKTIQKSKPNRQVAEKRREEVLKQMNEYLDKEKIKKDKKIKKEEKAKKDKKIKKEEKVKKDKKIKKEEKTKKGEKQDG